MDMKKNFKSLVIIFTLIFSFINCSMSNTSFKNQNEEKIEKARENVVLDFIKIYKTPKKYLKKRNNQPFNVFWIFEDETNNQNYIFDILPETQNYISLNIEDSIGKVPKSNFPNRFIQKNNKIFLWNDGLTPLSKDLLNVIKKYIILDSTNVKLKKGLLPDRFLDDRLITTDDKLEGIHYYVCRNNTKHFRRIKTNIAVGYYTPPKLKCN